MTRSVAFGDRNGADWEKAAASGRMIIERLALLLSPTEEEDLLREAGAKPLANIGRSLYVAAHRSERSAAW